MKSSLLAGSILPATLILLVAGCGETAQSPEEPAAKETSAGKLGPEAPTPPIVPSPVPSLPATSRGDLDAKDQATYRGQPGPGEPEKKGDAMPEKKPESPK